MWFAAAAVFAQPANQLVTARSYSGQFIAQEFRSRFAPTGPTPLAGRVPMGGGLGFMLSTPPSAPGAEAEKIPLEPQLLVVSCERVKELFLTELELRDEWEGRVDLVINPSLPDDKPLILTATHHPEGWNYKLELPKTIKPKILVREIVQVLFAELINRHASGHAPEIPFWLVEGMSGHLESYNLPTYIIEPGVQSMANARMGIAGMTAVRANLNGRAPLTFQQLSWPEWSDVNGKDQDFYDGSTELFFDSLMRFGDGQVCLRGMLDELPKHLNWQTAFIAGFRKHFPHLIDTEKWWGLTCVSFAEGDVTRPRTEQEYWHKLQDALDVPVDVHFGPSKMPAPAKLTLQEVILQWSPSNAAPALQRSIEKLESLQWASMRSDLTLDASMTSPGLQKSARALVSLEWTVNRELSPLVGRYLAVLINYTKRCSPEGQFQPDKRFTAMGLRVFQKEIARQLTDLDHERDALRAKLSGSGGEAELGALDLRGKNAGPVSNVRIR